MKLGVILHAVVRRLRTPAAARAARARSAPIPAAAAPVERAEDPPSDFYPNCSAAYHRLELPLELRISSRF